MAYQLPQPMWQTEEAPHKEANWLRFREEAGTILVEGDLDLEHPSSLEPHLQELWGWGGVLPTGWVLRQEMASCS